MKMGGYMRFVPLQSLKEGVVLKKSIYDANGNILLEDGVELNSFCIRKLKKIKIKSVYIEDEISKGIEIKSIISDELRLEAIKNVKEIFKFVEKKHPSQEEVNDSQSKIKKITENIIDEILNNNEVMVNMIDLKVCDDFTFFHSLNVAVLSIAIGYAMNLRKEELRELGLAGMLHDIGKVFIPEEVLNKKGRLNDSEFEQIKKHSNMSFDYLKKRYKLSAKTYRGILMHHERWDGSGYSKGLSGIDITLYARILGVADTYDALISDRPYRKGWPPSKALEYIMAGNGTMFDPKVVEAFIMVVAPYPVGTVVFLSNYKKGIVLENFEQKGSRPLIRIFKENEKRVEPYEIDLRDEKFLSVEIVNIEI